MSLGKTNKSSYLLAAGIILTVLLADQILKVWIKTNMMIGQSFLMFGLDWAQIHFIENEGMAWGLKFIDLFHFFGVEDISKEKIVFWDKFGKLFLSLFRIVAVGALTYLVVKLIKGKANKGLLVCVCLILAGALGNILDSLYIGWMFEQSTRYSIAQFVGAGNGYAPPLFGKVVDMFYFPLYSDFLPTWVPFLGGEYFEFFRPVFNLADAAISTAVGMLLINQKKFYSSYNEIMQPKES